MAIGTNRRRAILAAHGGVCFYCGAPDAQHIDHIIPRADGGTDDAENLIAACLPCNLRKFRHRLPLVDEERARAAASAVARANRLAPPTTPPMAACHFRAARAGLGWSAEELTKKAGVSLQTIWRIESGMHVKPASLWAVQSALEMAGIEFHATMDGGQTMRFPPMESTAA